MSITMAMEQGVTIILKQVDEEEFINVSSNHHEEIVLEKSGKIIDNEKSIQFSKIIQKGVQLAVDDLSLSKMKGGYLYLHFSNQQSLQNMKKSIILSVFLAILLVNGILDEYSI